MSREAHAGFCERLRGQFPRPTQPSPSLGSCSLPVVAVVVRVVGVEGDRPDGRPVPDVAAPADRVGLPGFVGDPVGLGKDLDVLAAAALGRVDVADSAVAMVVVVAFDEQMEPGACLLDGGEAMGWKACSAPWRVRSSVSACVSVVWPDHDG